MELDEIQTEGAAHDTSHVGGNQLEHRVDFDALNRDPNAIHTHLSVGFSDIFAEPRSLKTPTFAWTLAYDSYSGTKWFCYNVLSILCCLPAAVCWGCCFAWIPCMHIWCCSPLSKCLKLNSVFMRSTYKHAIDCFVAPLFAACGLMFSKIQVSRFNDNPNKVNLKRDDYDA